MINARSTKIGDKVFCIRKFGNYEKGYDMQIVKYVVKYKGTNRFIPECFMNLQERYQEVSYDECYKSIDEAKRVLIEQFPDYDVVFEERYQGSYYDVAIYVKKNR